MRASDHGESCHGGAMHPDQAAGLSYPTALLQMLQDRERLLLGQFTTVKRCALAFGEALLAGAARQDAPLLVGPIAETDA